jgi:histidinol-phosphate aminotransferase
MNEREHPTGNYVLNERPRLDFSLGENPWGCSPLVMDALRGVDPIAVAQYPDNFGEPLRRALGQHLSMPSEWFCLGTGALGVLDLVFRSVAASHGRCVLPALSFPSYSILARIHEVHATATPMCPDLSVDIGTLVQIVRDVAPDATILANPNNPTGRFLDRPAVDELVAATRDRGLLVLDEANVEFCAASFTDWYGCDDWPRHVIVVRSFSKAYGLASLRIGYAIAHPDNVTRLMKAWVDFPVSQSSLRAACAALGDWDHVAASVRRMAMSRDMLTTQLSHLGLKVFPSDSNYLLLDLAPSGLDSSAVVASLRRGNIGVLDGANFLGLGSGYIRISPRTTAENEQLITALCQSLPEKRNLTYENQAKGLEHHVSTCENSNIRRRCIYRQGE